MKILFVSTSIPPATDMHTTRNMYVIDEMIKQGHKVDVLTCGDYKTNNNMFSHILDKVNVHRTKYPRIMRWHNYVNKHISVRILKKIHNVAINYYAIPDIYVGWDKLANNYIKKNHLYDYDAIVTTSGSYTAHFIGKRWKEFTGKTRVADYGDPWGVDAYGEVKPLYYKREQPILKLCDGLIFTTESTIKVYKEKYTTNCDYELVTCGYGTIIDDAPSCKIDKILFTYMGIAYKRDRNLSYFLDAVRQSSRAKALLVGTIGEDIVNEYGSSPNICCRGRVPYEESLEIMSSSNAMVIVGNYGTMQIPGKTYIYLSSKKPILYIQQQKENDPTRELLENFGGVIICENNLKSINDAINYLIDNYNDLKTEADNRAKSELLRSYSWNNQAFKFVKFVEKCVSKGVHS